MRRGEATTIKALLPGDRFYIASDPHKIPLTVVVHEVKKTKYMSYYHWAKKDGEMHPKPVKSSTPLIFLRRPDVQ